MATRTSLSSTPAPSSAYVHPSCFDFDHLQPCVVLSRCLGVAMAALMGNDQEVMLAYVDRVVFKEVNPCVFLFLFVFRG